VKTFTDLVQNCCFLWVITLPGNLPKVYFVHLKTISGKRWRRGWGILGNFTRIIASKERSKFGTNIYYCQESFQNPLLCNVLSNTQKKGKKNTSSILFLLKFLVLEYFAVSAIFFYHALVLWHCYWQPRGGNMCAGTDLL